MATSTEEGKASCDESCWFGEFAQFACVVCERNVDRKVSSAANADK